jgi:hypothetical protein
MLYKIKDFIDGLKSNPRIVTFDEAATKQAIILPLLQGLGWNTHSVDEVMPEFPIEDRKVDYSLHVEDKVILLEVKRIGKDLEQSEKQLLEYSFLRGVEFAILTNGTHWWFYLPMKRGAWQTRKFENIDLIRQDSLHVAQKFVDLLSKINVQTGSSSRNAESIYRTNTVADTLPMAWNKLISLRAPMLIEIFSEMTEKMCGYRPEIDEIDEFIKDHTDGLFVPVEEKKQGPRRRKSETSRRAKPVIVAVSIAKLLDDIAAEYLKQPKHLPAHVDNITVYSHPEYLLEFTVRKTPLSNSDQLEFVATSKQIVNAFKRYCALHGLQNPYSTPSVFAARLRKEKYQLSVDHWEIVSKSSIAPYFTVISGNRFWKFVKTG